VQTLISRSRGDRIRCGVGFKKCVELVDEPKQVMTPAT